jgi:hypothetical protein
MPKVNRSRKTPKPKQAHVPDAGYVDDDSFDRFVARSNRIDQQLRDENIWGELFPGPDVLLRIVRHEYDTLSPESARQYQDLLRALVASLARQVNPEEGGKLALEVVENALTATEDLAVRSTFFIGLTCGMIWLTNLTDSKALAPVTAGRGAR